MPGHFTITLAQLNPVVGDLAGNVARILDTYRRHEKTSDLIVFTELVLTGYPMDDLVLKPVFIDRAMEAAERLAKEIGGGAGILVGAPWREDGKVYNAALLMHEGRIVEKRLKHHLPNYGVFDEERVFTSGPLPLPVRFKGARLGVMVCEDMWYPDAAAHLKSNGADILIVPNGSPYELSKEHIRLGHARARAAETGLPLLYVNQVGGQDELVFDGASFAIDAGGKILTQLPAFREYETPLIWEKAEKWVCKTFEAPHDIPAGSESIYKALVLGLRDYVEKNGFPGVLIGLSGGIDSALTAAIAADALGFGRVRTIMMPSPYTSQESKDDAAECAKLLGVKYETVSIEPAMKAFDSMLGGVTGVTAENIQARSRGLTLMALSNATGYMVLSTGNKSELSVGYATLYGDMCGGFNVLKDVYKMTVFDLASWRNVRSRVIPERIITKPPSAELRPNQKDEDSLPPYPVLDDILHALIEEEKNIDEIVARGHLPETVNHVWKMLDRAEYKRRQACPGVKISRKAFGRDRRYPIVNKFTDAL
jgi:NAD+ synthase